MRLWVISGAPLVVCVWGGIGTTEVLYHSVHSVQPTAHAHQLLATQLSSSAPASRPRCFLSNLQTLDSPHTMWDLLLWPMYGSLWLLLTSENCFLLSHVGTTHFLLPLLCIVQVSSHPIEVIYFFGKSRAKLLQHPHSKFFHNSYPQEIESWQICTVFS